MVPSGTAAHNLWACVTSVPARPGLQTSSLKVTPLAQLPQITLPAGMTQPTERVLSALAVPQLSPLLQGHHGHCPRKQEGHRGGGGAVPGLSGEQPGTCGVVQPEAKRLSYLC